MEDIRHLFAVLTGLGEWKAENLRRYHHTFPLLIAGSFLLFSIIWIVASDWVVWLTTPVEFHHWISTSKGTAFVLLTTFLIYILCLRGFRIIERANSLTRSVVESTTDAIYIKDQQGKYLLMNAAGAKSVGKSIEDVIGRYDTDFFDSLGAERAVERDRRVMSTGQPETYELELRIGDQPRLFHTTKSPFRDAHGKVIGVVGISRDTTERKSIENNLRLSIEDLKCAEAAITASKETLRLFIEHVPLPIAMLDRELNYVHASRRWYADFRLTQTDITGMNHYDVFPQLPHRWKAILQRCLGGQGERCEEDVYEQQDGSKQYLRWEVLPWNTAGGSIGGVMIFSEDITLRKRDEDALKASLQQLQVTGQSLLERESFLRFVMGTAGAGITVVNDKYEYVFVNEAYAQSIGRTVEETIGRSMQDVLSSEWAQIKPSLDRVLAGEPIRYEVTMGPSQNRSSNRTYRVISEPRTDVSGRPMSVTVIIDTTELEQTKRSVSESEERYRNLIELLPDAIYVNMNNRIAYCNSACVKMFGANSSSQLIGKSPFEFVHPENHEIVRRRIRLMLDEQKFAPGLRQRMLRLDGTEFPAYVTAAPINEAGARGTLVCFHDLTDRERTSEVLQSILGSVEDAIITIDEQERIQLVNVATTRMFGYTAEELIGSQIKTLMPESHQPQHETAFLKYLSSGESRIIGSRNELSARRKDGSLFPIELTVSEFRINDQRQFTGVIRDITERKQLEDQFQQSQKMEAVGRLAGGVAHDFNNLLTVIVGYSETIIAELPSDDRNRDSVIAILEASDRAARLTQQLLAFSRKSIVDQKLIDPNKLIEGTARLLRRLVEEDISLTVICGSNVPLIKVSPGQLEQSLMNIVVNSRDAMPQGGRIQIETKSLVVDQKMSATFTELVPGHYAQISISDTGHGMTEEVKSRIFEPFFTTKDVGKGTGLGLSVVHGAIKQCGGSIIVDSRPGIGTNFRLLFPASTESSTDAETELKRHTGEGTETILLVEDEKAVRRIARLALEGKGYRVLEAGSGAEAIQLARDSTETIDLLLTDVVMPEMSGLKVAAEIKASRPEIRVLYMSGYTDETVLHRGVAEGTDSLLQKPFTAITLARKVRNVLDGTQEGT